MRRLLSPLQRRVDRYLGRTELAALRRRLDSVEGQLTALQRQLNLSRYETVAQPGDQRSLIRRRECKVYSQNGEDGILLHLFATLGCTNRTFFEIGIQDGRECNSAHLAIDFGWSGVCVEGNERSAVQARAYYDGHRSLTPGQVRVVNRFVTAENIDDILAEAGLEGEIDLLSIDVDGNDYWLWKAITRIQPRVVVIEYNAYYASDKAITVRYDPNFARYDKHPSGYYFGAALAALKRLGNRLGYSLVACDSRGVNAFFVRKDVASGKLVDLTPEQAYYPLTSGTLRRLSPHEAFAKVAQMDFERIE